MKCKVCNGSGFEIVYLDMTGAVYEQRICGACLGKGNVRPRVLNKHYTGVPSDAVYIGRGSYWGNPFMIGSDGSRDEVIEKYIEWFAKDPDRLKRARIELKGKNLVCYCAPNRCHGDFLLTIANSEMQNEMSDL